MSNLSIFQTTIDWFSSLSGSDLLEELKNLPEIVPDEFKNKIGQRVLEKFASGWDRFKWNKAEEQYFLRVLADLRFVNLLGQKRVDLSELYVELALNHRLDSRRSTRHTGSDSTEPMGRPAHDWVFANAGVAQFTKMIVEGHPGVGKTTTLKHLASRCCLGLHPVIPIFLQLRKFTETVSLEDCLAAEFAIHGVPKPELLIALLSKRGRLLVLLDGIDEIATNLAQAQFFDQLSNFCRKFPKCRVVASVRVAASERVLDQFQYLRVAPFTSEQRQLFIRNWFRDDEPLGVRLLSDLSLPNNQRIALLGDTPLFTALICIAFENGRNLPNARVELYREAIDALLRKWDASRGVDRTNAYSALTPWRREQLLAQIASATFTGTGQRLIEFSASAVSTTIRSFLNRIPDLPSDRAEDIGSLLRTIEAQHGLIAATKVDSYNFIHLTFQEYFAARFWSQKPSSSAFAKLVQLSHDKPELREVIIMFTQMLDDAGEFLDGLEASLLASIESPQQSFLEDINETIPRNLTQLEQIRLMFDVVEFAYTCLLLGVNESWTVISQGMLHSDEDIYYQAAVNPKVPNRVSLTKILSIGRTSLDEYAVGIETRQNDRSLLYGLSHAQRLQILTAANALGQTGFEDFLPTFRQLPLVLDCARIGSTTRRLDRVAKHFIRRT